MQGDPFAAPSRVRVRIATSIGPDVTGDRERREAAEDWLLRRFGDRLRGADRGSGRSGTIVVYRPGPEVTERSCVRLSLDGTAEVRLGVGLPGRGRRILGQQAEALLLEDLRAAAERLVPDAALRASLEAHVAGVVTQRRLRRQLADHGLVAFVANGAVLPRLSGVDQAPLPGAVPFQAPASLAVALDGPDGPIEGLGVPTGVTLIVGGGFHGKSTVLQALQRGHLDHVPGDGRERVVSLPDTVKVRAEDGRRVCGVDISPFLRDLPGGRGTRAFTSEDASGSTSQAAAIVEAAEVGARVLLFDEDTCATNLMVRDARMRALVPREREPITPLVERVRQLHDGWGVSSVLVVGGVGDYLGVADVVIAMEDWVPRDVTAQAHALALPVAAADDALAPIGARVPARDGLDPGRIRARDARAIRYGEAEIDLTAVEQILDGSHAWTVGQALRFLHDELVGDRRTLAQLLDALDAILDDEGVEALSPRAYPDGALVRPRRHEVAAALNRLRTLRVRDG